MKKTVLMSAAKKARIALAVMAVCGMSFVGAQSAFAALPTTDLPVKTDANKNIICGDGAKVENTTSGSLPENAIVMGNGAIAEFNGAIALGHEAVAKGGNSVAFGYSAKALGAACLAFGEEAQADGIYGIAIGVGAKTTDNLNVNFNMIAFGSYAEASGDMATAFGAVAKASADYSVAIGALSIADEKDTVSVGGLRQVFDSSGPGPYLPFYRRIVNMADGINDHDAATVGQVKSMIAAGGSTLTQEQFNTMLDANIKFTGLQTEVGNKANANGDNITTGAGSKWAETLGTGAIANGDKNLVNGETVYNKIGDTSQLAGLGNNLSDAVMTVNTKAETALNKATDNEKKIGDTTKLTTAGLGDNLSDAVVNVNNKVGDTSKLTTANLGNNLSDAVVKVDDKTKQNAKDIEKVNGRVDELGGRVDTLGGAVSKLDSKVNKVGAGAAALAALHPMEFDSDNKLSFAAGVGSYHGASAAAIGAFYRPSEQVMFSIAGNMGNGENMVNAGVSFALDRPSKTPTTKAALVKTVVAQNEQIAALNETLAEQNKKIARLEAMVEKLAAKQNA